MPDYITLENCAPFLVTEKEKERREKINFHLFEYYFGHLSIKEKARKMGVDRTTYCYRKKKYNNLTKEDIYNEEIICVINNTLVY